MATVSSALPKLSLENKDIYYLVIYHLFIYFVIGRLSNLRPMLQITK